MRRRRLGNRWRRAVTAAGIAGALVAAPTAVHAAETDPIDYVALGDSSAAGPLIPRQISAVCLRSNRNWPHVVAERLGARLTDVTCSGATTDDLAGKQFGFVPPQYRALTPGTDLVTLAIGANDIDLGAVVPSCLRVTPEGSGVSCKSMYTAGGKDVLAERIAGVAPKIVAALQEIHRRSPKAEVLVVTYATYWQPGGCFGKDRIWAVDEDYLQGTWDRLHAMLAEQAKRHRAGFVDIRTPSAEHGVCAAYPDKWMEGLRPTSAAAPYHPNAKGMAASGATVAAAVKTVQGSPLT